MYDKITGRLAKFIIVSTTCFLSGMITGVYASVKLKEAEKEDPMFEGLTDPIDAVHEDLS